MPDEPSPGGGGIPAADVGGRQTLKRACELWMRGERARECGSGLLRSVRGQFKPSEFHLNRRVLGRVLKVLGQHGSRAVRVAVGVQGTREQDRHRRIARSARLRVARGLHGSTDVMVAEARLDELHACVLPCGFNLQDGLELLFRVLGVMKGQGRNAGKIMRLGGSESRWSAAAISAFAAGAFCSSSSSFAFTRRAAIWCGWSAISRSSSARASALFLVRMLISARCSWTERTVVVVVVVVCRFVCASAEEARRRPPTLAITMKRMCVLFMMILYAGDRAPCGTRVAQPSS